MCVWWGQEEVEYEIQRPDANFLKIPYTMIVTPQAG